MRYLAMLGVVGAGVLAQGVAQAAPAGVVVEWNEIALDVGRNLPAGPAIGPNPGGRIVAISQLAVYDAVISVSRAYEPYLRYINPDGPVLLEVAVAQAAHDVLVALQPNQATSGANVDHHLELWLSEFPDGPEKANGIALGQLAAASLVASRINDGSAASVTYPGSTAVGFWRPTPREVESNAPLAASDPQWADVVPFGLLGPSQFRTGDSPISAAPFPTLVTTGSGGAGGGAGAAGSAGAGAGSGGAAGSAGSAGAGGTAGSGSGPVTYYDLSSEAWATAYNEVRAVGWKNASSGYRTPEQTEIARFWALQTHIPFNAIAGSLIERDELGIEDAARLFAILNIALADSRIAVWDTKYEFGFWRPITAIRAGDTDNNPATEPDPAWVPLLETPNHPEFVSGHSATGAAGATILALWFGNERSFSVRSSTLPGVGRDFDRFSDAGQENANSRLYGGIHYRFSNELGLDLGEAVGNYVFANLLKIAPDTGGEGGAGGEGATGGSGAQPGGGNAGEDGGSEGGVGGDDGGGATSSGGKGGASGAGGRGGSGGASAGRGGSAGTDNEGGEAGTPGGGRGGRGGAGGAAGGGGTSAPADDDDCSCSTPGKQTSRSLSAPLLFALSLFAFGRRRRRTDTERS
jgi:MYXO-CTERM domain-containing protein